MYRLVFAVIDELHDSIKDSKQQPRENDPSPLSFRHFRTLSIVVTVLHKPHEFHGQKVLSFSKYPFYSASMRPPRRRWVSSFALLRDISPWSRLKRYDDWEMKFHVKEVKDSQVKKCRIQLIPKNIQDIWSKQHIIVFRGWNNPHLGSIPSVAVMKVWICTNIHSLFIIKTTLSKRVALKPWNLQNFEILVIILLRCNYKYNQSNCVIWWICPKKKINLLSKN